jgi:hypothetical protein
MYFPPQGKTDLLSRERKLSGKFGEIIVKEALASQAGSKSMNWNISDELELYNAIHDFAI